MTVYRIGHLERLPLKTPYPAQLERVRYIMARLPRETDLVVDFTGVGRGIYDMLVDAGLRPIGVTIHSGFEVHTNGDIFSVPKSTLVSTLVARLHAGELVVHESLKDWPILRRELLNFRPEVTRSGLETWNARSGEHDDLVLALGLAVFHLTGSHVRYRGLLEWYRREAGDIGAEQWCVGVDLGQSVDPTAIAVLSKSGNRPSVSDEPAPPRSVILHAEPYAAFQAASGRQYRASETGEIEVLDPDDARDLQRAAARLRNGVIWNDAFNPVDATPPLIFVGDVKANHHIANEQRLVDVHQLILQEQAPLDDCVCLELTPRQVLGDQLPVLSRLEAGDVPTIVDRLRRQGRRSRRLPDREVGSGSGEQTQPAASHRLRLTPISELKIALSLAPNGARIEEAHHKGKEEGLYKNIRIRGVQRHHFVLQAT